MKKLLSFFFVILSCTTAWASTTTPQVVQFVWPWASGAGGAANMMRHLLNAANQQQTKYEFVWTQKLGAGSSIAANHVLSSTSLAIIANGDAMYTRPLMYNEAHDITKFQVISAICSNTPLALYSKKYTSVDQLRNVNVSVGINPGTATQMLTSLLMANNPDLKFTVVPYKGLPESITDMLGGHLDATVAFLGSGSAALSASNASILGITGTRGFANMPTFASQRVKGVEQLTNTFYIFAPRTLNPVTAQDFNRIFNAAINSDLYKEACLNERGQIETLTIEQAERLHQSNQQKWQRFTQGIAKQ